MSDTPITDAETLVKRLRGIYAVGPIMGNGEPEFGYRKFDFLPRLYGEAADRIERLERELAEAKAQLASRPEVVPSGWQPVEWCSEWMNEAISSVRVQRTTSPDYKGNKYAVRSMGMCLNKSGAWEDEPSPSNRDSNFYARCRFDSLAEALKAADSINRTDMTSSPSGAERKDA